mgnify:CR=1 FL=1
MDLSLTDTQQMYVDTVQRFVKNEILPHALEMDRKHVFPMNLIEQENDAGKKISQAQKELNASVNAKYPKFSEKEVKQLELLTPPLVSMAYFTVIHPQRRILSILC